MPIGTKFQVEFKSGNRESCNIKTVVNKSGKLFSWCDDTEVKTYRDLINAIFIPIQQPVSFMEVVSSGKKCRVDLSNENFTDSSVKALNNDMDLQSILKTMTSKLSNYGIKQAIINGKWYIEESEGNSNE